jgi:hypothetical protein
VSEIQQDRRTPKPPDRHDIPFILFSVIKDGYGILVTYFDLLLLWTEWYVLFILSGSTVNVFLPYFLEPWRVEEEEEE